MKLFNYKADPNFPELKKRFPVALRDARIYTGKYAMATAKNSTRRRPSSQMISMCGQLTTDFAEALCRAAKVYLYPNTGDGYGIRIENRKLVSCMAEVVADNQSVLYGNAAFQCLDNRYSMVYNDHFYSAVPLDEEKASFYLFALWAFFMLDPEFKETFMCFVDIFKSIDENGKSCNDSAMRDAACKMADIVYYMTNGTSVDENLVHMNVNTYISPLNGILSKSSNFTPTEYIGTLKEFSTSSATNIGKQSLQDDYDSIQTDEALSGYFQLDSAHILSDEEQKLLVTPKNHVPSHEAIMCCKMVQASSVSRPIRNILLRGESGFGKTETARNIALGLGLPYVFITCSSETEIYDLLGQMMPNEADGKSNMSIATLADLQDLPSPSECSIDPPTCYRYLTKIDKPDATELDCMVAIINKVASDKQTSVGYHYVESPLVKAIRNGWLCELQEPSVITRPGALVGLNGLLDESNAVYLPTGEVLRRHPNTVIVATTNLDYEGCRAMNQSFLSRFQVKIDLKAPDANTFEQRIRLMTNCPKDVDVRSMLAAYTAVKKVLSEHYLTDGSVDMRTVADWVASYMVLQNYVAAAEVTIIPSATTDPDGMREVAKVIAEYF